MKENQTLPHKGFDHTVLMSALEDLIERYPFFSVNYLGTSILDRSIPMLSIGNGRREVLYVGAHHGMEWITSMLLCRFASELGELYEKKTSVYHTSLELLLDTYTLYIVPMLNPDGVDYQIHGIDEENPLFARVLAMNGESRDFTHWQANARGVDLNHNYDAGFADYKRLEKENGITGGAPTRYSGEGAESEPETASLCNFIRFRDQLCGVLTLHTQGGEIIYQSQEKCSKRAPAIAKRLASWSGYTLAAAEGLASYGGLTDWCIQRAAIPAFTVECGRGENPLPPSDAPMIYGELRRMLFCFPTLL